MIQFNRSKAVGFLIFSIFALAMNANTCFADEWTRLQSAHQSAQTDSAGARALCPAQAAVRTRIDQLTGEIAASLSAYQQRDSDMMITDVQADYQQLSTRFQALQTKVTALNQLRAPAQAVTQTIESAPGFSSGAVNVNAQVATEIMASLRQMLSQALAIHDAIQEVMEDNEPLMSFNPKPSYANWMAIANYKQNPAWYQNRNQLHTTLQDEMDALMREAYSVYGNRTATNVTWGDVRTIYLRFVNMRTELASAQRSITNAQNVTQEMLSAMTAYPGIIRAHRATLASEAESKANQIHTALEQAKAACLQVKTDMRELYTSPDKSTPGQIQKGSPYEKAITGRSDKTKG